MRKTVIKYEEVRREVFDGLVTRYEDKKSEPKWESCVTLRYNGTEICGSLSIEVAAGERQKEIYLDVMDTVTKLLHEYYW